ncbi:MAG: type II toxin-antitoxin system HicB family antitoxin [Treponema sp.]|jgi:predicted RNase H-like HicB family nuclease|nr:type II toxin-antitoxin system HicB family antitoxin [Treponema sp.]
MEMRLTYTYWEDGPYFVGCLNEYSDDSTQGLTLAELEEALKEVYEIRQEERLRLSPIRHTGVLTPDISDSTRRIQALF